MNISKSKWGVLTVASSLLLMACGNTDTGTDDSMISTESSVSSMMSSEEMSSVSSMDSESISSEASSESIGSESQPTTKGIENTTFDMSIQDAVDMFHDAFPNAKVTSVAIDNDRDSYVYEVEGYHESNSVEIKIDAYSGEIVKQKDSEDREDNAEDDILDLEAIVSPQEAMKAALDEVGSGYAKEWEIDSKNGQVYYEIDIEDAEQSNDDVHIDAKTGDFIGYD